MESEERWGFGSEQGGHEASVLALRPKLRILVMGLYYVLKDHEVDMKVSPLLVLTACGLPDTKLSKYQLVITNLSPTEQSLTHSRQRLFLQLWPVM
jgi:hypothetical protein